jgi:hypothetical protein
MARHKLLNHSILTCNGSFLALRSDSVFNVILREGVAPSEPRLAAPPCSATLPRIGVSAYGRVRYICWTWRTAQSLGTDERQPRQALGSRFRPSNEERNQYADTPTGTKY